MRVPRAGLKPRSIYGAHAALKRRSSTVVHAASIAGSKIGRLKLMFLSPIAARLKPRPFKTFSLERLAHHRGVLGFYFVQDPDFTGLAVRILVDAEIFLGHF